MNRVQEHLKKEAENRKVVPAETEKRLNVDFRTSTKLCTKGHFSRVGAT